MYTKLSDVRMDNVRFRIAQFPGGFNVLKVFGGPWKTTEEVGGQ